MKILNKYFRTNNIYFNWINEHKECKIISVLLNKHKINVKYKEVKRKNDITKKIKETGKKQGKTFSYPSTQRKELVRQTQEMVSKVNKRLRNLERGGYYNSYASKKLFNRLDTKVLNVLNKSRKGKHVLSVKVPRNLTNTQLKALQKATKQFLVSQTSTTKGIINVAEATKKSMLQTLKLNPYSKVTEEDIEDYYEMLGSKDFDYFNEKIGASAMWNFMEDAKEFNQSKNQFLKTIELYGMSLDENARNKASRLYEKYIL